MIIGFDYQDLRRAFQSNTEYLIDSLIESGHTLVCINSVREKNAGKAEIIMSRHEVPIIEFIYVGWMLDNDLNYSEDELPALILEQCRSWDIEVFLSGRSSVCRFLAENEINALTPKKLKDIMLREYKQENVVE